MIWIVRSRRGQASKWGGWLPLSAGPELVYALFLKILNIFCHIVQSIVTFVFVVFLAADGFTEIDL